MRIIKFRIHIGQDKKLMHYKFVTIERLSKEIQDTINAGGEILKYDEFTGLLDKNGKEIYEGDIVRWTSWKLGSKSIDGSEHKADKTSTVIWNKGAWQFDGEPEWNIAIYSNMEVIGNIYENPELLS